MNIQIIKFGVALLQLVVLMLLAKIAYPQGTAGPNKTICCNGGSVVIGDGTQLPDYCYSWDPPDFLDDSHKLTPTANPTKTTKYTLTVIGPNFSSNTKSVMTVTVEKPTGETTTAVGWYWAEPTVAMFSSNLLPSTVDFSGNQVTERDGGGGFDGCWFVGCGLPKINHLTGGTWSVVNNNLWGDPNSPGKEYDYCGVPPDVVNFYRIFPMGSPRAPCQFKLDQYMDVVCPNGNEQYKHHLIIYEIGFTTISATRNGVPISKTWP